MPCRIIVCFVPTKSKNGEYSTNPFDFERSWTITESTEAEEVNIRERILEDKLTDLQNQLLRLQQTIDQTATSSDEQPLSKNKGRGKKSQKQQQTNPSFLNRIRGSFSGQQVDVASVASTSHASVRSDNSNLSAPPPYSQINAAASKTVYIKKVELLLNGSPLDQIDCRETSSECIKSYWRMFQNSGFPANSPFTNGISYQDFR